MKLENDDPGCCLAMMTAKIQCGHLVLGLQALVVTNFPIRSCVSDWVLVFSIHK